MPDGRWQFSLWTLMLAMVACAVFFGVGKVFGVDVLVWVALVALLSVPMVTLAGSAKLKYATALSAVYGPFVVMATYTYFFVACSHCNKTTWAMLPYGPGVVPVELGWRWLDLERPDGTVGWAITFLVGVALVLGLTWVLRTRGGWWQAIGVVGVLALCSFGAFVVLALIRA